MFHNSCSTQGTRTRGWVNTHTEHPPLADKYDPNIFLTSMKLFKHLCKELMNYIHYACRK